MNETDKPTPEHAKQPEAAASQNPASAHAKSANGAPTRPKTKSRRNRRIVAAIVAVLVIIGLSFSAAFVGSQLGSNGGGVLTQFPSTKDDGNKVITKDEADLTSVVDKVSPSVVSIVTTVDTKSYNGRTSTGQAAGTGMVISKDGYIMTNKHVIDGAKTASVVLSNGKIYKNVRIIGSDPLNDVAFLKISGVSDLKPVSLGDSKTVHTGQNVLAIGNALGQYQNTVTSGIISGLGRPVQAASEDGSSTENLSDLLQTDAAINSGNSGGPLLNFSGQVVGMNTAVAQDAQSIGFAIPIGATKGLISHLLKTGEIERAYLGVQYISITPEVRDEYDLPVGKGDYVSSTSSSSPVISGSPADEAGLKNHDIITKINGEAVDVGTSTSTLVGEFQPGDKVSITVLRDGKTKTLHAILSEYQK